MAINLVAPVLETLITDVRSFLNQMDSNNSFWSDEELSRYLNEAVRRYFQEVVIRYDGQFTTSAPLDLVSGTETVALPGDCFEVKTLFKNINSGERYEVLEYDNNVTDGFSTDANQDPSTYLPSYMFRGNNLVLRCPPQFNETGGLQLEYVQFPTEMINGGDTLTNQIAPVFKDLIEMYAVYKAKLKESLVSGVTVHTAAQTELQSMWTSFKDAIDSRTAYPKFVKPYNPENF